MKKYWANIREKYPKAFEKLVSDHATIDAWGKIDSPKIWGEFVDEEKWTLRHLFDFFDSKKINIWCYSTNAKDWHYAIVRKGRYMSNSKIKYKNRELAELAAYEKAFEILEIRLNKRKHE